ncbi:MAG TPA: HDOD domain-containing protein [Gallionella sp.]|nr:HDOD domain-containing protein [Gallionella sp.]
MSAITTKDEILANLHQLPAIPAAVQEVIASFKNDNLDNATLAYKISQDQSLSAKTLRVANSAFYGLPRNIGSIQDAVVVLGLNSIRSLALSAGFAHAFPPAPGSPFDRHSYWMRSFRVAGYTKALAQCLRQGQQMAYTAGMFYEVGQLVLDVCIPEQFANILQQQKASGLDLIEIEQAVLGFDHALIGAEMARRWNFPPEIEHAILYWRTPEREPFEPVTGIVHVAALLESGLSGDALINHLPQTLRDRLKISWERIEACMPEPDELDAMASMMLAA